MGDIIELLKFPSSALLAVAFLVIAFAVHYYARDKRLVRVLGSAQTGMVLLGIGAVLLAVEGTWSVPVHRSGAFVAYLLVLLLSLSFAILKGFKRKACPGFMLNHVGLFIIVWASLFGAPDVSRSKVVIGKEVPVNTAYSPDGLTVSLPFEVCLDEFTIDYYPDGKSPRQFTSRINVDGERLETSVNHPCSYRGYTFFQDSYDREAGRYSVLLLVRAPWLPVVYLGMTMLAVGAVLLLFGRWKAKITIPLTLVLTVVFTFLTVAKINFGTLMPALRSWWFVPHLFIYMVAYALMALALLLIIVRMIKGRQKSDEGEDVPGNLVRSSSALLIIGMLTGSVWAHQAWGDYWAWDPKENWAAATWFIALMYFHMKDRRGWKALVLVAVAFLALQITWYGVNVLPSAAKSMHTYIQ